MSAELHLTFSSGDASPIGRVFSRDFAETALNAAARLWFLVTILGQLLFAFTIAAFYGRTAARGDFQAWNRFLWRGYVAGDTAGNLVVAIHLASAVVILLAGALQFVPAIRSRFPAVHRWNGRVYILTAFTLSLAGLYIHWIRGTFGDMSLRLASTLNALLIWLCAAMAIRYAVRRDFKTHRRWALRLFLVVSAAWFFRAGLFLTYLMFKGPAGFDTNTFKGPMITFLGFAQYLVPLALLELYVRARERPGALRRYAMASALVLTTVATSAGVFAIAASVWVPSIAMAFDNRKSIANTMSATLASGGLDAAIEQYRALKMTARAAYNFDESELNQLGYLLVRANKFEDAVRIFQLNVEAYPRSSNAYDSLAEAYRGAKERR